MNRKMVECILDKIVVAEHVADDIGYGGRPQNVFILEIKRIKGIIRESNSLSEQEIDYFNELINIYDKIAKEIEELYGKENAFNNIWYLLEKYEKRYEDVLHCM